MKAVEIARSGALGRLVMGRGQLTCWYPPIPGAWRQDAAVSHGGALIDMGTHCLDLLEQIMGSEVREVFAFQDLLTHNYPTNIEDTSTVHVRFENGAHGIVDNYFNVPDAAARNALEVYGTKGALIARETIGQDPAGEMVGVFHEQGAYDAGQVRSAEPVRETYRLEGKGIYGTLVGKFADAIQKGTPPEVPAEDGMHSVRLVLAIYRSAEERRAVRLTEIGG